MCSLCRIRKLWISLSLVYRTKAHSKIPDVISHRRQQGTIAAGIGWTVSARLFGAKRSGFPMKSDLDSTQKI